MIGTHLCALQIRRSPGSYSFAEAAGTATRRAADRTSAVNAGLTTHTYNAALAVVPARYRGPVKQIWQGRAAQVAAKYGEQAPMAAVCCNACRTCVTTNVVGLATAALAGVGYAALRFTKRLVRAT
jgi:hypothetical protein